MGAFRGEARLELLRDLRRRFSELRTPALIHVRGPAGSGRSRLLTELYELLAAAQAAPYWQPLGVAERNPGSARDLSAHRRLELAPARLEGLEGITPDHLWLAMHGDTAPSKFAGHGVQRIELLGELDAQLQAHFGPVLRSIEARFGVEDARRVARFVLSLIPGLGAISPLLEAWDLRELVQRARPSASMRAARAALEANDVVEVADPGGGSERVDAVSAAILSLAGPKGIPVLLVIDDAELADHDTIGVVRQLLESDARIMIVTTTRSEPWDGLAGASPFDQLIADLHSRLPDRVSEEPLPPLTRRELGTLVTDHLPGAIGAGLQQVLDAAGDSPLVLQAILVQPPIRKGLLEGRSIADRHLSALPRSVEDVFAGIWDALEDDVRSALAIASIQGNPFDAGWLERVDDDIARGFRSIVDQDGMVVFEQHGVRLLGRFRRSWVHLRAREALRTDCEDELLERALAAYLDHVDRLLQDPAAIRGRPRLVRSLLGAYVAHGVGDGIVPGRHTTQHLDLAAMMLAEAEEELRRLDVALDILGRVRASGAGVRSERSTGWALLEARLQRSIGRPRDALSTLGDIEDTPASDELTIVVERIRCQLDARIPVDPLDGIASIEAHLAPAPDRAAALTPVLRGEACRVLTRLIKDGDAVRAVERLEALAAAQEPLLDEVGRLRLRSDLAKANAFAGRFHRARELLLGIEADLLQIDPSGVRSHTFRGSYATWLPVVGEFELGVRIMDEHWSLRAEVLSERNPGALSPRGNLIYWLVEGGAMTPGDAASEYAQIVDRMRRVMEPDHPTVRNARINRALMLMKDGRFETADQEVAVLRAELQAEPVPDPDVLVRLDLCEAGIRAGEGDLQGALRSARRAHSERVAVNGPTAWRTKEALAVRVRLEETGTALRLIDDALAGSEAEPVAAALNPAIIRLLSERARVLRDAPALARVLARQEELLGPGHEDSVRTRLDLAELARAAPVE